MMVLHDEQPVQEGPSNKFRPNRGPDRAACIISVEALPLQDTSSTITISS
jgi:hypothetical protein